MSKQAVFVGITDHNKLQYKAAPGIAPVDGGALRVSQNGRELSILCLDVRPGESETAVTVTLGESIDLREPCVLSIAEIGEWQAVPTDVFDSAWFAQHYHYDKDDLGALISGETTTFKLWAPTASAVVLELYAAGDGGEAFRRVDMTPRELGVWSCTEPCGHGTYYTYTVTTAQGTARCVDPYARAAGVNGERGMVVDLSLTDPDGWETARSPMPLRSYSEAVIWEIHVRDFSNRMPASRYPGKYLAFTEQGLCNEHGQPVGLDYLKELGVTHVHLLPVFDYATVDESNPDACFNWGYDPQNYNVPEGSYSTDPYHGEVRIRELKQLVMALHSVGIGVITDMVYNHTYAVDGSFGRTVPYYYYRYADGVNTSHSGCGNDTASERYMFGKFMVDSTAYWVREYALDGLRFDLMGLHDVQTMQAIERAVHAINPHAILYGEGWKMGGTLDGRPQADQTNIGSITPLDGAIGGIAVFNDVMRDGLKGSVFKQESRGYISGAAADSQANVLFGLRGGRGENAEWSVDRSMVINYMSAHDNHTLWDKLSLSAPTASEEERFSMNALGALLLLVAKGTPFWQGGEELLRSKGGDENSYRSSDEVNNLDWSVLRQGTLPYRMVQYYKGLIEMRRGYPVLYDERTVQTPHDIEGVGLALYLDGADGERALVLINPTERELRYTPDGSWQVVADHARAGRVPFASVQGETVLEPLGAMVCINTAHQ